MKLVPPAANVVTKSEDTVHNMGQPNYDDIIELNRPLSKYPKMNQRNRAAQFAPYATLSGQQENVSSSENKQKYNPAENTELFINPEF